MPWTGVQTARSTPYETGLPEADLARLTPTLTLIGDGAQVSRALPSGRRVSTAAGGCAARGRIAAFGSVVDWLDVMCLPQELNAITARAGSDPRVITAERPSTATAVRSVGGLVGGSG